MITDLDQTVYSIRELIFAGFLFVGIGIMRFLGFIMPKTYNIFFEHFKKSFTKDLEDKIEILSHNLEKYRQEKHIIENENKLFKQAILSKDEETLDNIKNFYEEE